MKALRDLLRRVRVPPISAYSIEPTNDCNDDCPYCHRKRREVGYMSLKGFKWLIGQVPPGMPVTLSYGGESIVHPFFKEMAEYAASHDHKVTVYSNGLAEYPEGVETIVYAKPPPIVLTWDQRFEKPNNLKPTYKTCPEPYYGINILWNGDIVPCCRCNSGNRVMGNVFESNIAKVWANDRFRELRLWGHCENCEVYRYDLSAKAVEDYAKQTDPGYRVQLNKEEKN